MNFKFLSWILGIAAGTALSVIINRNSGNLKKINAHLGASYIPDRRYSRHLYDDSDIYYV